MKRVIAYTCIIVMTLSWMALIYGFSAQTGTESGGMSALIAEPVARVIMKLRDLPESDYGTLYSQVDRTIRAMAHFTEYAVLGILMTVLCRMFQWRRLVIPWLICTVFAVTDEWHQYYTPGRSPDPKDVLIDTAGVITGIILFCLVKMLWKSRKKHLS